MQEEIKEKTPFDVAKDLGRNSKAAIKGADLLLNQEISGELKQTLLDITAMGYLGLDWDVNLNLTKKDVELAKLAKTYKEEQEDNNNGL